MSLTAMGSEVRGSTGHFQPFYQLDQILNRLRNIDLVHLQAGWFMENLLMWTGAVAQHGRIGWSLRPEVKSPWVATEDIADLAARELTDSAGEHRVTRQLGADFTMPEIAAILSEQMGHEIGYRFIDRTQGAIQAEYLKRFGTPERWLDDSQTMEALNDGRVRLQEGRPLLPTSMEAFVRDIWKPRYLETLDRQEQPESFATWVSGQ